MPWKPCSKVISFVLIAMSALFRVTAQQQLSPEAVQRILDRLDKLEKQNEALTKEIQDLRQELSTTPPLPERLESTETQTKEQAQTKVSASQRFPISLTGMFLFDTYKTSDHSDLNIEGNYGSGVTGSGATLRQSIIGLEFFGPHIFGDGQIHGSLAMDFYGESQQSGFRIRRGVVSFDWRRRSITFGQDKPLIAPLEPTSFAHVGIPPLSGAGNLWLWLPQARYEERVPIGANTELKAQAAIIQTDETYTGAEYAAYPVIAPARPGAEARLELQRSWRDQPRFTIGVGGHTSTSHILGQSVPSRVLSADLKYQPKNWFQFSGTFLHGQNFGNLGGLDPGVTITNYMAIPVRASAGWIQAAFPVTSRLTFDFYAGRQLNAAKDLIANDPFRSLIYAGNILYRVAPNVVLGFEGGQTRVSYLNSVPLSANRYDATIAYLF